jgi:U6 snRNA-associated Sm-like protein LSm1
MIYFFSIQAEKAEREARDLKGTMRKRMEFLDFD